VTQGSVAQVQFVEFREVRTTEPLRQGDVLEAADESASMWQRHLLVITADCDFANDKHQGRVTCVPLLNAQEYLAEMQMPKLRDQFARKRVAAIREELLAVGGPTVSDDRLRAWASEEDPAAIGVSLGLQGTNASNVQSAMESIRLVDAPTPNLADAISNLVEAHLLSPNPPRRDNVVKTVAERLRNCYSQPPGDALFLSAISGNHQEGYFAYLRHLEQVWQPEISISPTRSAVRFRRISRMQDRFTHALVQRFGMVFMSIGLPKEYEDMRDLHSELMGDCVK
jgi:hypothetical protein